jgi:hypothetical protein
MTLPSAIFGFITSTLYGALFHLIRGGSLWRLALYIFLSWLGFWLGHLIADLLNWDFLSVGPLHLGIATIFSWLFMLIGSWLSHIEVEHR